MRKLQLDTRAELVMFALANGVIGRGDGCDRLLTVVELAVAETTQAISGSADAWMPAAPRPSVVKRRQFSKTRRKL